MSDVNAYPSATISYPSFDPPSAPPAEQAKTPPSPPPHDQVPMAQPVFYEDQSHGGAPHAVHVTYVAPSLDSDDTDGDSYAASTLRLVVFHLLNSLLAWLGFAVAVVGTILSVALLPLCCFGVLVFRLVLFLVGFLAQLDVELYNFISPSSEHVFVSIPQRGAVLSLSGKRLSPKLGSFSPVALSATLYFATIKFLLGLLSNLTVSIAFSLPISALSSEGFSSAFDGFFGGLLFVTTSVLLFFVGVALMHVVARWSRAATRYFCCEKFNTYSYVHASGGLPVTAPSYGTNEV